MTKAGGDSPNKEVNPNNKRKLMSEYKWTIRGFKIEARISDSYPDLFELQVDGKLDSYLSGIQLEDVFCGLDPEKAGKLYDLLNEIDVNLRCAFASFHQGLDWQRLVIKAQDGITEAKEFLE